MSEELGDSRAACCAGRPPASELRRSCTWGVEIALRPRDVYGASEAAFTMHYEHPTSALPESRNSVFRMSKPLFTTSVQHPFNIPPRGRNGVPTRESQRAKGCLEGSDRFKQALRWCMLLTLLLTYKRNRDILTVSGGEIRRHPQRGSRAAPKQ